jgi:hypothetical protein
VCLMMVMCAASATWERTTDGTILTLGHEEHSHCEPQVNHKPAPSIRAWDAHTVLKGKKSAYAAMVSGDLISTGMNPDAVTRDCRSLFT